MATIAPALDPPTAGTSTALGTDAAVEDEAVSVCFRIERDGTLRLLAPEPAAAIRPAPRN